MRARNIKPSFFDCEEVGDLSMSARILFIGLWCMSDSDGFLEYRPKKIKANIFPYDSLNLIKLLEEVSQNGLIVIWGLPNNDSQVEGMNCHFIEIPNFRKHQRPHPQEKRSNLKEIVTTTDNLIKLHEIKCNFRLILGKRKEERGKRKGEETEVSNRVIDYLNEKTKKSFKKVDTNISLITARIDEGFKEADFLKAIDNQVAAWSGDKKMETFLRPATLFQKSKFDGYVNNGSAKGSEWI